MDYSLRKVADNDTKAVIGIFNYYAENTFAAYPEKKVPYDFFDTLKELSRGYPFYVVETANRDVVGFGLMRPYHRVETFQHVAEVTYFILPAHTSKGLGTRLLQALVDEAKKMKIKVLLADISARNDISLRFHAKNGFKQCGRFERVGKKFDEEFDVIWMQKFI